MNILKSVLKHEVFPALGCTEPTAVAYAASLAAAEISGPIKHLHVVVDPGVYKNGFAVTVPNTGGETGNLIAGMIGALIRKPELKMEILQAADAEIVAEARALLDADVAVIEHDPHQTSLYIDVRIETDTESSRAVIKDGHTHLVCLEKNGNILLVNEADDAEHADREYRKVLRSMTLADLVAAARGVDDDDAAYIRRGIEMNLELAGAGNLLKRVGYYVSDLLDRGYIPDDVFASSKILAASATDARMAGESFPAMASGGSGNQGIVAILVPYNVGRYFHIDDHTIVESIALSHLLNSYTKCHTGDLSVICGCAIAAGVGAAAAIVYQQYPDHLGKMSLAVNTLISDLGGMLCDGAKAGCALKVASSTDSVIRAAYMALNDHGITAVEGFVGERAEDTIRNLSRISRQGMGKVDDIMLDIMRHKPR